MKKRYFLTQLLRKLQQSIIFTPAEDYHQDYFELNGDNPYCQAVVRPKLEKFRKVFKGQVKEINKPFV
jgi:peptide-methionine (S)-S-oxide reductase